MDEGEGDISSDFQHKYVVVKQEQPTSTHAIRLSPRSECVLETYVVLAQRMKHLWLAGGNGPSLPSGGGAGWARAGPTRASP